MKVVARQGLIQGVQLCVVQIGPKNLVLSVAESGTVQTVCELTSEEIAAATAPDPNLVAGVLPAVRSRLPARFTARSSSSISGSFPDLEPQSDDRNVARSGSGHSAAAVAVLQPAGSAGDADGALGSAHGSAWAQGGGMPNIELPGISINGKEMGKKAQLSSFLQLSLVDDDAEPGALHPGDVHRLHPGVHHALVYPPGSGHPAGAPHSGGDGPGSLHHHLRHGAGGHRGR